ncbi:hypothetical protein ACJRO7_016224 [Eucalyptus globulus]|uniref:Leucine-rich repeat-containing N-terminal plant-type domain-containing protein n=1 Tax=Eucalyptus globulus TaxID=34317 RepID=A0ABD3LGI8_EUCGL
MEKFIFLAFVDVLLASLLMFQPIICSSNFTNQEALLHFKSTMEVDPTNTIKGGNWTVEANFCEWIGVVCSSRRQRVTALDLSHMGLQGRLSPYLGNLSLLASLDLRNNSFYGMILMEIGHLRHLKKLILELNYQCQNLEVLSLATNWLMGGIPREFGTFLKLQQLNLSSNDLWGQIPSFLGNISTLQVITLANASLTGLILSALFNRSLTWVNLNDNYLSGSLPFDLCYRWPNIQMLSVHQNQFSGLLPETLTQCKELIILWLSYNRFQGSIPRDIGSLHKLQKLYIDVNNLTGTIPQTIGNMSSLQKLQIAANNIEGEIPSEIGKLVNLQQMALAENLLTGEMPQEVFNISSLQELQLMINSLSGSLPSGRDLSLLNLKGLHLFSNGFSGNIPQYFSNFSNLIIFYVENNQLSGPIHRGLGNLKNLEVLDIALDQLT